GNDAVVVLDTELTPELEAEGRARDLVRLVQQARKDRDLDVTDRIELKLALPGPLSQELEPHLPWVLGQVLATGVSASEETELSGRLGDQEIGFDFVVSGSGVG
ncbi:MAG: DUF5915 domain-containing protein, partial [Actinomycetota bacterium]